MANENNFEKYDNVTNFNRDLEIKIDPRKNSFNQEELELTLRAIAKDTIHNLLGELAVGEINKKGCAKIILTTRDSSYDLSAFYTQLTKNGYIIK